MKRVLAALSALLTCSFLMAQSALLPFTQISVDNGLPHTDVQALYQDKAGFMWIGTLSGLCRYDGVRIETFNFSNSSLQSSRISCLAGDPERDILYIGTETGGLSVFDLYKKEIIENIPIPSNRVNHIFAEGDGKVWVCGEAGLSQIVFKEKGKDVVFWSFQRPVRKAIPIEMDGGLLLIVGSSVVLFDCLSGTRQETSVNLPVNDVLKLQQDIYLVASSKGTYVCNIKTGESTLINSSPSRSLLMASDETLYIGTLNEGLIHLRADYSVDASFPFRSRSADSAIASPPRL